MRVVGIMFLCASLTIGILPLASNAACEDALNGARVKFFENFGNHGANVIVDETITIVEPILSFQGRTNVVHLRARSVTRVDGQQGGYSPPFEEYIASDATGIYLSRGDAHWEQVVSTADPKVRVVSEATLGHGISFKDGVLDFEGKKVVLTLFGTEAEGTLFERNIPGGVEHYHSTLGLVARHSVDESRPGFSRPRRHIVDVTLPPPRQ